MNHPDPSIVALPDPVPHLPGWVVAGGVPDLETAAFRSGAALAHLVLAAQSPVVPQALWRDRLALAAAAAVVGFDGRSEGAADLRDARHLRRADDLPGPAGAVYLAGQRAAAGRLTVAGLQRALPDCTPAQIAVWLDAGQGAPVSRAALVLETVLADLPHGTPAALILADAVLAQALGLDHLVPLLACGLKRADLRLRDDALRLACHRALTLASADALRLAADLARRAAQLRAAAPRLRAKAAPQAVALFLTQDAVAPAALPLPDRAARRLCDRLVALGALRELTGRDTFRLYGV